MKQSHLIFGILFFTLILTNLAQVETDDGGIAITGSTWSYVTGYIPGTKDAIVYKLDRSGNIAWFDHYGGIFDEHAQGIRQTSDGGYVLIATSVSYSFPDRTTVLYKLDAGGAVEWRRDYGINDLTDGCDIHQTADGGYLLLGETYSMYELGDMFLIKLDGSGNKQWQKLFGGSEADPAEAMDLTADGGCVVIGWTRSYTHGETDFLVYKFNAMGQKQWRRNFGGAYYEFGASVKQTSDGGYILAGTSESYAHGAGPPFFPEDCLVYKLNAAGLKQWRRNYGGYLPDHGMSVQQTTDGGFILAGKTQSYVHGDNSGWPFIQADTDFLVYKLNAAGIKQWRRNYGGQMYDPGSGVLQTADGGYLLLGSSKSYVHGTPGKDTDMLLYKINASGIKQWRKNYGGINRETATN